MAILAPAGISTALALLAAGGGICWSCLPCGGVWLPVVSPRPPLAFFAFLFLPRPPVGCSPASEERGEGRCEFPELDGSS
eukprot:9636779-Lingulodinium_polyedra.AAC.1